MIAGLVALSACVNDAPAEVSVIESLSQPRGLSIAGSTVCVAEAGAIGPEGSSRQRAGQVEAETGRVVCASLADGGVVPVLEDLPFVYYPEAAVTSGAADVIMDGDDIHVLVGESFGGLSRMIVSVTEDGVLEVADLLTFAEANATAGGGLRSNPFSFVMTADGTGFFVADAATGTVLLVGRNGVVQTFSAVPGHEVLTGTAMGPDGDLYVASFGQLPHPQGTGSVVAIDFNGDHRVVVDDLTMVIDVGFAPSGDLLILEYATASADPGGTDAYRDDSGRLLHVPSLPADSSPRVLLEDLNRPTALTVSDDAIFISISAGELAPGLGSVVSYELDDLIGTTDSD